jgi:hypothetical protein
MSKSSLTTAWNLGAEGDDFYAALIAAHNGLSDADSQRLNARLILLLANHVGDASILTEALRQAREDIASSSQ